MESVVLEDNCCGCHFAAYNQMMAKVSEAYVVYITYHVDVAETPFLVALDFTTKSVVVSIRGTLSLQVRHFRFAITDIDSETAHVATYMMSFPVFVRSISGYRRNQENVLLCKKGMKNVQAF